MRRRAWWLTWLAFVADLKVLGGVRTWVPVEERRLDVDSALPLVAAQFGDLLKFGSEFCVHSVLFTFAT